LLARAEIVPFQPLDREALGCIVALKLDDLAERVHNAHGLSLQCTQPVIDHLAEQCEQTNTGARRVERLLEDKLMPGLARELLRFQADDDMPALARFELDDNGELSCVFADIQAETASA
jgi:type VI secretion system protein VasG